MLHIVLVQVQVLPDRVGDFRTATLANASASLGEAGVARFDVIQEGGDPTRFLLIEAYRDPAAAAAHKETAHYQTWRDTVAAMMATPRASQKYLNVFPDDGAW